MQFRTRFVNFVYTNPTTEIFIQFSGQLYDLTEICFIVNYVPVNESNIVITERILCLQWECRHQSVYIAELLKARSWRFKSQCEHLRYITPWPGLKNLRMDCEQSITFICASFSSYRKFKCNDNYLRDTYAITYNTWFARIKLYVISIL